MRMPIPRRFVSIAGRSVSGRLFGLPGRCQAAKAEGKRPAARNAGKSCLKALVELADGRVVTVDDEEEDENHSSWEIENSGASVDHRDDLQVVLFRPQIPPNTGNIARTCAATRIGLHLVGPLGFDTSSKKLKRAGLTFWPYVVVKVHPSWDAFHEHFVSLSAPKRLVAFSKYGSSGYAEPDFEYKQGDWLLFGSETSGLPEEECRDPVAVSTDIPARQQKSRAV